MSYVFTDQEFKDSGLLYKMFYIMVSTSLVRPKYYIAWKLSKSVTFFLCRLFLYQCIQRVGKFFCR